MKKLCLLLLLFATGLRGYSCLNIYGRDIHGEEHMMEHRLFQVTAFSAKEVKKRMAELGRRINTGMHTWKDVSDYGAYMLMAGLHTEALQLFIQLNRAHPNEYAVIQNLGTAYELNGKPDSAFLYIKQGYVLNPLSHNGSEWLHIRYLEKINAKTDIRFSENIFLDTAAFPASVKKDCPGPPQINCPVEQALSHVIRQLEERIPFTLLKDDLLAKLLMETGDLYAENLSVTRAHVYYAYADYFATLPEARRIIAEKINKVKLAIQRNAEKKSRSGGQDVAEREYHFALKNLDNLAKRKPMNTEKWDLVPLSTLLAAV